MNSKRRNRVYDSPEPVRGPARGRVEEKRRRYYDETGRGRPSGGLQPTALMAVAGIVLAVVVVALVAIRPESTAPVAAIAQGSPLVPAATGTMENGKATVSVEDVRAKSMVYWDIQGADGKTTPLMAYFVPSGAAKVAVRICDGNCDDLSFRIEGKQIVCDACGTRWDLETTRGISGGCQNSPPKVLPSSVVDGKIVVDV